MPSEWGGMIDKTYLAILPYRLVSRIARLIGRWQEPSDEYPPVEYAVKNN
jgi:hypothetical protein